MIWNHNVTPPAQFPDKGSAIGPSGRFAWSEATSDASLAEHGFYRQGINDPVPEGDIILIQERIIRDGKSVLARQTGPAPDVEPQPEQFPNGVETESILWPNVPEGGHHWETHVVEGVMDTYQASASPLKSKAERAAIKAARKEQIKGIRAELPALLESGKLPDLKIAVQRIAEILNLT